MGASFADAARIAARQNGRITTAQLRDCGFSRRSIERRVDAGQLHRVHVGVYAVGHLAPSRLGDWHAAVLACGEGAVLSHRCAATLMQIRDGVGPRIDVTTPTTSGRSRPDIHVHLGPLPDHEVGTWSDIPVTSPARHDGRPRAPPARRGRDRLGAAADEFRRLFDRGALELANRRRPNRTITRFLRELEPTDGREHDQPSMRAADAARDNILHLCGFLVLRYRWADVHRFDGRTTAQILQALRMRHP